MALGQAGSLVGGQDSNIHAIGSTIAAGKTVSNQASPTKSGISGIAGDQSVRTGDTTSAGTLVKDWNTETIVKDVQAQAQIAQQFSQNAAREIGTYADKQRDAALARGDKEEAAKWDEGGEYRVAAHTAAGALSGGVSVALAAGASAALMPKLGEAIADMDLPTPVAQALGAATAAAIGGVVGGAAGAGSAYSIDINNRQLHPTERAKLKETAKQVARDQIPGFDQLSPEQKAKAESYWYDQLAQAALARVDDKGKVDRNAYLNNVSATDQQGLQGGFSAEQVLANAATADRIIEGLANQNQPILNIYGEPVKAGNDDLIAFNATAEQRANSFLLNTPTAEAERQRIAQENSKTLEYLGAINGGAERDYTVEEFVLGGAIGGRAVKAIAEAIEGANAVLAPSRSPIRTGSYEGASVTVDDARMVFREVELPPKQGTLRGEPEAPRANASQEDIRGITRQNEAAETLSKHGLDVERLPNDQGKSKLAQPDLKINGEVADVYSPKSGNVQSIWDTVNLKVNPATDKFQANNIVINLVDSHLSATEVAQFVQRNPIGGLKNLVILKDGNVTVLNMGW